MNTPTTNPTTALSRWPHFSRMIRGFLGVPLSAGLTAALLFVVVMAGCKDEEGGVVGVCDNTSPLAGIISPACGATGVALNQKINATFNEVMDSSTVTATTFTLAGPSGTPVSGTVTYVSATNIATFTPSGNLAAGTTYTYTIRGGANGVKDLAGNALANNFGCSFTTGAAPDITPPTVISTNPAKNATGVPLSKVTSKDPAQSVSGAALNKKTGTTVTGVGKIITATFSEAMDPLTITNSTVLVTGPGVVPVIGSVTYAGPSFTATFMSANNLAPNTTYTGTITTGAKDLVGNALASNYAWSFTTGAAPDVTPPTVTFTDPDNGGMGVALNKKIAATFSEAMSPSTINATTFTLQIGTTSILGAITYTGTTALFTPANNLVPNTLYTATITIGAKDLAGNALASNYIWNFTTGAAPDITPPTVISTDPTNNATGVALNKKIAATFSEAMDPLTITTNTFTVRQGTTSVSGTLTYVGTIAVFTPANNLAPNTVYTATITIGAKDLAGNALASSYIWNFTTGAAPDITPPTVISTDPTNNATGVALNKKIAATFNEAMDPSSITTATVTLTGLGGVPVIGTVSYAATSNSLTFTPSSDLASNTTFTVTIKGGATGAKDLAGNALINNYVWSFRTADVTPPTVISTDPVNNATGVALNKKIAATFSEAMTPITTATFTVTGPGVTPVTGTVVYVAANNSAIFTPTSNLAGSTLYTATITIGAKDLAGNALASNYIWNFTTGAAPDITPPTVISTDPANNATDVPVTKIVAATFSEAMDASTITATGTFTLMRDVPVTGVVGYTGTTLTFTPASNLASNTIYTATITTGAKDLAGNALASNYVWTFTTGAPLPPPGPAVNLGSAATFGIMATSAITNVGNSTINGDVSLDPGTSMTGFPPGVVNGTIHINDAVSALARADLLVAYNSLKGLAPGTTISAGADLGALYPTGIPPGTYTSGSTMLVSTPLVLDAGGNANAVWVFQIGSSLTTGASVSLANGAQAKNVFWVPTSDATIGVGTTFYGTIVAGRDVTAVTGATIYGRILAGAILAGTIALQGATVNVPLP